MTAQTETPHQHARTFGSPGLRARFLGLLRIAWPLLIVTLIAGYLLRVACPYPPIGITLAGFLFLLLAMSLALGVSLTRVRLESFLKGARGEEWVARELAFLPATYTVLHSVSLRASGDRSYEGDYDHIVLGPNGVFVIETKNWTGDIRVADGAVLYNGKPPDRPPLEQVKRAAASLRIYLAPLHPALPELRPILCFVGDAPTPSSQGVNGVLICHARTLVKAITDASTHAPIPASHLAEFETTLKHLAA